MKNSIALLLTFALVSAILRRGLGEGLTLKDGVLQVGMEIAIRLWNTSTRTA
jgi:hypothetical protein